jgi:(p)ppGpp synthase/HD superfamily hydrolase
MWSQDELKRALDFAARAHGDQKIPGSGLPYVVHVVKVMTEILAAAAADSEIDVNLAARCALLHDCVEDAGVTHADLVRAFGQPVADGVAALSKDGSLPKEQQMGDSLARIRRQPREIWAVKLADRITNLEPAPPHWSAEKRKKYRAEAEEILSALRGASAHLERRMEEKIAAYVV